MKPILRAIGAIAIMLSCGCLSPALCVVNANRPVRPIAPAPSSPTPQPAARRPPTSDAAPVSPGATSEAKGQPRR